MTGRPTICSARAEATTPGNPLSFDAGHVEFGALRLKPTVKARDPAAEYRAGKPSITSVPGTHATPVATTLAKADEDAQPVDAAHYHIVAQFIVALQQYRFGHIEPNLSAQEAAQHGDNGQCDGFWAERCRRASRETRSAMSCLRQDGYRTNGGTHSFFDGVAVKISTAPSMANSFHSVGAMMRENTGNSLYRRVRPDSLGWWDGDVGRSVIQNQSRREQN